MARYSIDGQVLTDIADAINAKTGETAAIAPGNMAAAIGSISGGDPAAPYYDGYVEWAIDAVMNAYDTGSDKGLEPYKSVCLYNMLNLHVSQEIAERLTDALCTCLLLAGPDYFTATDLRTIGQNGFRYVLAASDSGAVIGAYGDRMEQMQNIMDDLFGSGS
jgi:hypothetical protein